MQWPNQSPNLHFPEMMYQDFNTAGHKQKPIFLNDLRNVGKNSFTGSKTDGDMQEKSYCS